MPLGAAPGRLSRREPERARTRRRRASRGPRTRRRLAGASPIARAIRSTRSVESASATSGISATSARRPPRGSQEGRARGDHPSVPPARRAGAGAAPRPWPRAPEPLPGPWRVAVARVRRSSNSRLYFAARRSTGSRADRSLEGCERARSSAAIPPGDATGPATSTPSRSPGLRRVRGRAAGRRRRLSRTSASERRVVCVDAVVEAAPGRVGDPEGRAPRGVARRHHRREQPIAPDPGAATVAQPATSSPPQRVTPGEHVVCGGEEDRGDQDEQQRRQRRASCRPPANAFGATRNGRKHCRASRRRGSPARAAHRRVRRARCSPGRRCADDPPPCGRRRWT